MEKIFRKSLILSDKEYKDLTYVRFEIPFNIERKLEIDTGDDIFYFKILIKDNLTPLKINKVHLSIGVTSKRGVNENFSYEYRTISSILGVKKVPIFSKGNNGLRLVEFFINIEEEYSSKNYVSIREFYTNQLKMIEERMSKYSPMNLLNEIYYKQFENESDLIMAIFSIFANINNLEKEAIELIDNKLNYIGLDRFECSDKYTYGNINTDWQKVLKTNTKQDKLEFLISLITHIQTSELSYLKMPCIQKITDNIIGRYIDLMISNA